MALLDRVREVGLRRRLARSTIACYQSWIREFLRFSKRDGRWRTPAELGAADVERYLSHLARDRRVSASTQNQALVAAACSARKPRRPRPASGILTSVRRKPSSAGESAGNAPSS